MDFSQAASTPAGILGDSELSELESDSDDLPSRAGALLCLDETFLIFITLR
jgi:hypothetical protein